MVGEGNQHDGDGNRHNYSGVRHNGYGVRHINGGIQHIGAIDEKKDESKPPDSLHKLIVSSPSSISKFIISDCLIFDRIEFELRCRLIFFQKDRWCSDHVNTKFSYGIIQFTVYSNATGTKLSIVEYLEILGRRSAFLYPSRSTTDRKTVGMECHTISARKVQVFKEQVERLKEKRQILSGEKEGEAPCTDGSEKDVETELFIGPSECRVRRL
ncbi:hypothetical protein H5410_045838 [Solanum commersonii]|uniref:Uncharacterized protein n=1 Tax=Solanum commersonii TaxID=4109 RepID=A0A9J5XDW8_SOLCO|nr:hypothetical protein H5410_045838 [Solanum commersonii]